MEVKGRGGCVQEQDCLSYRFQVIITNSPRTGFNVLGVRSVALFKPELALSDQAAYQKAREIV